MAAGDDEDSEVTQCADLLRNLTQHLHSCFAGDGGGGPPPSAPLLRQTFGAWHRAALGLVEAGWSMVHEEAIYSLVQATAGLLAAQGEAAAG